MKHFHSVRLPAPVRRLGLPLVLAASAWMHGSASATDPRPVPEVLTPVTVRSWVNLMASNHPALKQAGALARAARLDAESTRRIADPKLMFGGSVFNPQANMPSQDGNLIYGIEQPLPLFGKETAARALANANATTEEARVDARFQELRRDLAIALFQTALAQEEVALATDDEAWLAEMAHTLEARLATGRSTQVEVLRAQTEHSRRRVELENLRNRERETQSSVNRLLVRNPDAELPRLRLPDLAEEIPYSERLVRLSQNAEPRLRVIRRERQAAEAMVDLTRKSRRPDLALGIDGRQYSGDGQFRMGTFLLSVNLPLWNRDKYRRDLERERARLQAVEDQYLDSSLGLREEIHHLTLRLNAVRREALLNRDEILPRAESTYQAALAQWTGGRGELRDVLEARRIILEARFQFARAVAEQWSTLADLVLCCGLGDLEAIDMLQDPDAEVPAVPNNP